MKLSFFPSYIVHPPKMRFADQEADEEIELLLRQHWVTNTGWLTYTILAILLPLLLINSKSWFGLSFLPEIPLNLLFASLAVWYLLIMAYIIENFLHWYFNIYIVTNLNLIDIDFDNLLSKKIVESSLTKVESTSGHLKGVISSFFNFGDVFVQTAAESQQITFLNVPYPATVTDRINDLSRQLQHRGPQQT
jgi:membrane protein YdbS with pleckstrin-like domain